MINWHIKADEFANCNCDYGCPCQFNALPTHGDCKATVGFQIKQGRFGDVVLDGLRMATVYCWPGPVHEGNGEMQLIVDEGATEEQRDALIKIIHGEETEEMATVWAVYAAMCPIKHETLSLPIDLAIDVEERTGQVTVPGVFESIGEPIRNATTGEAQVSRINLPNGFEYEVAEMGSGVSKATGKIKFDLKDSYGQFAHIHLSQSGLVKQAA